MAERLALYPGTFDPFTKGHLDIVERSLAIFDRVEVTVSINAAKTSLLPIEERCELVRACTAHLERVSVAAHQGLIVERARSVGAVALVRGLRQASDFDYEVRLAAANREMMPDLETVFLPSAGKYAFISASIVRDVHGWGGDVTPFVPPPVVEALLRKRGTHE